MRKTQGKDGYRAPKQGKCAVCDKTLNITQKFFCSRRCAGREKVSASAPDFIPAAFWAYARQDITEKLLADLNIQRPQVDM
jgi:hypothetical protein